MSIKAKLIILKVIAIIVAVLVLPASMKVPPSYAKTLSSNENVYSFYGWTSPSGDTGDSLVQPSLLTGAATHLIPIEVPPGTGRMEPALVLTYNSRRKHGNAGKGWSLELPKIVRSTKYGIDKTQGWMNSEAVYLYGQDELRNSHQIHYDSFGCSAVRYIREVERYERILFCQSNDYWTVTQKDGTILSFGRRTANNSRLQIGARTYEYYLDEVKNTRGLSWQAFYSPYGWNSGNWTSAPRLEKIQYTYYTDPTYFSQTPSLLGTARVIDIQWEDREDGKPEYVDFRYGMELRHKRVSALVVKVGSQRVRKYELRYDAAPNTNGLQFSPDSDASMLQRVRVYGTDDTEHLPDITFEYKYNVADAATGNGFVFDPVNITYPSQNGFQNQVFYEGRGDTFLDLIDLNGDGRLDFVKLAFDSDCNCNKWFVNWGKLGGGFVQTRVEWVGVTELPIRRIDVSPLGSISLRHETIDMNADGLPDLFVGENIYLNTGKDFRKLSWNWPFGSAPTDVRFHRKKDLIHIDTQQDLQDGNGDGCPDWWSIGFDSQDKPFWLFFRNKMCDPAPVPAFDTGIRWFWGEELPPPYLGRETELASLAEQLTGTLSDLKDINGDGLVDFYWHEKEKFYIGTGRGFQEENGTTYSEDFKAIFDTSSEMPVLTASHKHLAGGGVSLDRGQYIGFFDMNGDGRVDLVRSGLDQGAWKVWLNTGRGLQRTSIDWQVPALGPIPLWKYVQYTRFKFGSGGTAAENWWRIVDLDSSQTADLIYRPNDANAITSTDLHLYQNRHNDHQPDLLVKVDNGRGSHTDLTYDTYASGGQLHFPVAVLRKTETYDLPDNGAAAPTVYTTGYTFVKPFFDRKRRSFQGFGEAYVHRSDNLGTPWRWELHGFHVGNLNRRITEPYTGEAWIDHPGLVGRKFVFWSGGPNGSNPRKEVWTRWMPATVTGSGGRAWNPRRLWRREFDIDGSKRKWRETSFGYDAYGSVNRITTHGEVVKRPNGSINYGFRNDEVTIRIDYALDTSPYAYIVGLPSQVKVCEDVVCQKILRHRLFFYDYLETLGRVNIGNLTTEQEMIKFGVEAVTWAWTNRDYDDYGNVVRRTDPEGAVAEYTYSEPTFTYLESTSTTVSRGKSSPVTLKSMAQWDERFGQPVYVWDPNGRFAAYSYDSFGRLTTVRSSKPDVSVAQGTIPSNATTVILEEFEYSEGPGLGDNVVTYLQYFGESPSDHIRTYYFFDGLDRPIQEQSPYPVWEGNTLWRRWSVTNRQYDYNGHIVREVLPRVGGMLGSFQPYDFSTHPPAADMIEQEYDWWGRITRSTLKGECNGSTCEAYTTRTVYNATGVPGLWSYRVEYADPRVKAAREYEYDAYGRTRLIKQYEKVASSGDYRWKGSATYKYDRAGNLIEYRFNGGGKDDHFSNVTRMAYDSRGLLRWLADPDLSNCGNPESCPRNYFYDKNGRLIKTIDSVGQQMSYKLDELGRVYYTDYCDNGSTYCSGWNPDASFTYDEGTGALGRLSKAEQDGQLRHFDDYDYDYWGRLRSVTRKSYDQTKTTQWEYDLLGRMTQLIYPSSSATDEGEAPAEKALYTYYATGHLRSIYWDSGQGGDPASQWIVEKLHYDETHMLEKVEWGNGLETVYAYETSGGTNGVFPGRQSLQSQVVRRAGAGPVLRSLTYDYFSDGNVQAIYDVGGPEGTAISQFEYDHADRLERALIYTGQYEDWRYEYRDDGNLTRIWKEEDSATDRTYVYNGAGPHAVTKLEVADGTFTDFTYNVNGELINEVPSVGANTFYFYNYEHTQYRVTHPCPEGGYYDTYLFLDAAQNRALKYNPARCKKSADLTYYFGDYYEVRRENFGLPSDISYNERYVLMNGQRIAYLTQKHPGKIFFLHQDHSGSPVLITDETGQEFSEKMYRPFGAEFSQVGEDSGLRHGYTGQEEDKETGLIHLGVRQYDSDLRRWLKPDPIVADLFNPQSMNRYSYVNNNPIASVDPTGYQGEVIDSTRIENPDYVTVVRAKRDPWAGLGIHFTLPDVLEATEIPGGGFDFQCGGSCAEPRSSEPSGSDQTSLFFREWKRPSWADEPDPYVRFHKKAAEAEIPKLWNFSEATTHTTYFVMTWAHMNVGAFVAPRTPAPVRGGRPQRPGVGGGGGGGGGRTGPWWRAYNFGRNRAGTMIPESFNLEVGGQVFRVHPNATKHMAKLVRGGTGSGNRMFSISSLAAAVEQAQVQGLAQGRNFGRFGNWELGIDTTGNVIYHALYRP